MRVSVLTTSAWNDSGKLGAFCFVVAPIIGGVALVTHLSGISDAARFGRDPSIVPLLVGAVSGIAWSIGIVLMLNGRQFVHEVEIARDTERPVAGTSDTRVTQAATTATADSDWSRIKSGESAGFGPGVDRRQR